jgi:hypothetical protein
MSLQLKQGLFCVMQLLVVHDRSLLHFDTVKAHVFVVSLSHASWVILRPVLIPADNSRQTNPSLSETFTEFLPVRRGFQMGQTNHTLTFPKALLAMGNSVGEYRVLGQSHVYLEGRA